MQTFIILIVSILFSIGTTAIIYMLLKNHVKKNTLCYLTSFIGFTLIVIFAFVQSECICFETWSERTEIVEQDMKKLAHLTTSNAFQGNVYLTVGCGTGNVSSKAVYTFYEKNEDGSYELKQINAEGIKIIEINEEEPNIKRVKYRSGKWQKLSPTWYGRLLKFEECEGWKKYDETEEITISVPVGSISTIAWENQDDAIRR